MWKTLHPGNAIEGAAITVRFAEPLSAMLTKKLVRSVESDAKREGFLDSQPLQHFQVQFGTQAHEIRHASAVAGVIFSHSSIVRQPSGEVVPQLSRQFIVQPDQIVLQIQRYRNWQADWHQSGKVLFSRALEIAAPAVPVSAIRLEYLNRFVFDGTEADCVISNVLQKSDLVSQHIFSAPDLWHSHTGRFDEISASSRRLLQVNADLQLMNPGTPLEGLRTLGLMLAVERQFPALGLDLAEMPSDQLLTTDFNRLHDDIRSLFKSLIDSKFAERHGLPV